MDVDPPVMTQEKLLRLIERASNECWKELDLNLEGSTIFEFPPEIGQLTNLEKLTIDRGQPSFLTKDLITGFQLKFLPPEIGKLTNLRTLDLSDNWLIDLPQEVGYLTNLQTLNVGLNQLTNLPSEIGQLSNLQTLNVGLNQLTNLPSEIGQLSNLQFLNVRRNQLTNLPSEIGQLCSLQELDISSNQLETLPAEMRQLNNLRNLFVNRNILRNLPPGIGRLSSLEWLVLFDNRLKTLPSEMSQLTSLLQLELGKNQFAEMPSVLFELSSLKVIEMIGNSLTRIPSEISHLFNLAYLNLNNNKLRTIPSEIGQLHNLRRLDLDGNKLNAIPSEIGQLTNLNRIGLSNNEMVTVPSEIGQLSNLQWLDLSNNQLTTLPPSLCRRRIRRQIEKLHLYGNPLPISPELLKDSFGFHRILFNYLEAIRPLHEAKLLLVGEGSTGKTSLVERLLYNQSPSDTGKTIGVDIHHWEVALDETVDRPPLPDDGSPPTDNRLRVNVWDFGGQEIFHATHQFFLTHRSLYLVVLEARKDEAANRLDYWLRHVQSFAGDAPVILVVNKSDQGRLALDERGLMLKHPTIQAIVHTSCTTGAGIDELRDAVETALASLPHINDWIPLTWFEVKKKLAALEQDTLPYDSYVQLCLDAGIEHEAAQRTLARFLHDLGAALNFQDDRRLAGTHVLNPEWVTGGIYHILNADKLQENGLLHLDDLDAILDRRRYPPEKQPFLLEIMHKFELSVPLDRDRYLIPGLLPKERPAFDWPTGSSAALEYRYAILPAAILSRLMVRLYAHIWQAAPGQPVRWRNGLVIHGDGCRAVIAADPPANRLSISLDGPTPQRRHLLAVVRAQLAEIHASFAQLEAEAWVPLPDQPGKAVRYRALLNLESRGIATHYDPDNDVELDVYALLDGIEAPDERAARPLRQLMVERFNMDELRTLCFDLGLDIETWPNEGKPALVRNLVLHFLKQGRLAVLEEKVRGERPY